MDPTQSVLEKVRINELAKFNKLESLFGSMKITATSRYSNNKKKVKALDDIAFKPGIYWKYFMIILISTLLLLLLQQLFLHFRNLTMFQVALYILLAAAVILLLRTIYRRRKNDYQIIVNDKGITVTGIFFAWQDIHETAILRERYNRETSYFLIIVFYENGYQKIDIGYLTGIGFWKTGSILSNYIEYFKARSIQL